MRAERSRTSSSDRPRGHDEAPDPYALRRSHSTITGAMKIRESVHDRWGRSATLALGGSGNHFVAQCECQFDRHHHRHRDAVLLSWIEAPLLYRRDRLLIQTKLFVQGLNDTHIAHRSIGQNDGLNLDHS